jgi:hypothetical protein
MENILRNIILALKLIVEYKHQGYRYLVPGTAGIQGRSRL